MSIVRPGLEQIDRSGATVGQVPAWDPDSDTWVPTTVTSGGGTTDARTVLVYTSGAYPARPTGGLCEYVGPTQPTTWLAHDTWIKAVP